MQVYMANGESEWITDQVHIKAIILGDPQELTFDVLNSIKYDAILGMPWLREKNPGSIGSAKIIRHGRCV
jgi:hypothetical protein